MPPEASHGRIGSIALGIMNTEKAHLASPAFGDYQGESPLALEVILGAKSITALLVPEASLAYQVLALNTEKAHNLKGEGLGSDSHVQRAFSFG